MPSNHVPSNKGRSRSTVGVLVLKKRFKKNGQFARESRTEKTMQTNACSSPLSSVAVELNITGCRFLTFSLLSPRLQIPAKAGPLRRRAFSGSCGCTVRAAQISAFYPEQYGCTEKLLGDHGSRNFFGRGGVHCGVSCSFRQDTETCL